MIGIGINENVYLSKASVNRDKGTSLIVVFKQVALEKERSLFEQMNSSKQEKMDQDASIRLWNFKVPKDSKTYTWTDETKYEAVVANVMELKNQCNHILEQYTTSDNIHWNILAGTGIEKDTEVAEVKQRFLDQDILNVIFDNITEQFIEQITPYLDDKNRLMRLLLVRQGKDKPYPALRSKFLEDSPFLEPMTVLPANSRLKFTKYEEKEGLTDKAPTETDSPAGSAPEAVGADEGGFGSR
jgi:hypothetical protein